ncbi:HpcH/HpaI aldolase/citrate lyase family protein [Streptomyces sp. NPDC058623]|uniref:HpcH/HpaI aldolase/citrate lyase family protein n=1 Tax=Streptomyces sp. NPDC058623 TaxID=3346563 RepID=UPI0036580195
MFQRRTGLAPRSYLYVPGDRPEMLAKALGRGADALIIDLEDAVAPSAKDLARTRVHDWLAELAAPDPFDSAAGPAHGVAGPIPEIWIRVNPDAAGLAESRLLAGPSVTGLCLAKCAGTDEIAAHDEILTEAEHRHGIEPGALSLAPLLETASAVLDARSIAQAPRVRHLQLGEADLCAELGIDRSDSAGPALSSIRTAILLASAAAGLLPPVGPVATDFTDLAGLARDTEALRGLGYRSRACIHPRQLATVHAAFTPSAQEVAAAADLLDRFTRATESGSGVVTGPDGRMIDEAVIRAARRLLATRR